MSLFQSSDVEESPNAPAQGDLVYQSPRAANEQATQQARYAAQGGKALDSSGRSLPLLTQDQVISAMEAGKVDPDRSGAVLQGNGPTHAQYYERRRQQLYAVRQALASASAGGRAIVTAEQWLHGNAADSRPWGKCSRCSADLYPESIVVADPLDPGRKHICEACAPAGSSMPVRAKGYQPPREGRS